MDSGYCPKCGKVTGDMHDRELCAKCHAKIYENEEDIVKISRDYLEVLLLATERGCVTCPVNPYGKERYDFAMEKGLKYKYDCSMDNCSRYHAKIEARKLLGESYEIKTKRSIRNFR